MKDFNEDVTNILNSIKSLYKGCESIDCKDCPLNNVEQGTIEYKLCTYLWYKY